LKPFPPGAFENRLQRQSHSAMLHDDMNQHGNASPEPAQTPHREEAIFHAALYLPETQRAAFLAQACGGDTELLGRVSDLLKAHQEAGDFLEQPAELPKKTIVLSLPTEKAGDKIGRYKLLQQIGEGGCGVVYMAEQEEPVRRRVALKVIKLGMDTKSVIARFEAERQALALMDHPNIAKVLDAGSTENGRPFFVMEMVRGIKITDYCDQNKLSTDERLQLFIQVCHAIQHAHQKGIIHRDIKPSNILVTLHDGVPMPKVIDFGIAKATQGRLTDQTLFTAFEQFIGTPAYMSPEQAEMSGLDIDTRCDIYALGVLLYELLTGRTPFDARELINSGIDQMRHTIREKEPQRPSTVLSTMLYAELNDAVSHRRTDAPKLVHLIRGDLDWIVMKSLEKDRTRRYETASSLAMDVQRHRDNEPVLASPPSSLYRFQKLVRRNKTVFAAISGVIIILIIGLGVSLYMFSQERRALRRALAAEAQEAKMRRQAEEGAEMGAKLSLAGLLLSREQFDEAERLVNEAPPHPASASIYNVLGAIRARQGLQARAISNFLKALGVAPRDLDAAHSVAPLLAWESEPSGYFRFRDRILQNFGSTGDPIVAERIAKDCLLLPASGNEMEKINRMVDVAVGAGPEHKFWRYFQFARGLAEYRQGKFVSAATWMQEVLSDESDPSRTVAARMILAMAQRQASRHDEARVTFERAIKEASEKIPESTGAQWNDQLSALLFVREGKALFENVAK
jgi:serine/threonine protein kinase/Flp pilus assembly protein TadD